MGFDFRVYYWWRGCCSWRYSKSGIIELPILECENSKYDLIVDQLRMMILWIITKGIGGFGNSNATLHQACETNIVFLEPVDSQSSRLKGLILDFHAKAAS